MQMIIPEIAVLNIILFLFICTAILNINLSIFILTTNNFLSLLKSFFFKLLN